VKLLGLRTALYLRRSTEEHQDASLDVQQGEGSAYIAREGGILDPVHVFVDDAKSRAEFKKRPGLIAMLNAAERRAFDAVVVRDESRLGGDTNRTSLLIQDLTEGGVRLFYYFGDEEVILDGAVDRFMLNVRAFASELEREKISQRTHEHLLTKARRGLNVGGRVYGYDNVEIKDGDRRVRVEYRINPDQAAIVLHIFERYVAGDGLRTLAKDLNRRGVPSPRAGARGTGSWSTSAIFAMLRRDRYRGAIVWGRSEKAYRKGTKVRLERAASEWVKVDAPELRIVPEHLWTAVQAIVQRTAGDGRRRRAGRPEGSRARYLLSGLARCAECGGPLTVTNGRDSSTAIKVYACAYRRSRGEAVCSNTLRRPVATVDSAVLGWVAAHVLTDDVLAEVLRQLRQRLAERSTSAGSEASALERDAAAIRLEVDRLVTAIATTADPPEPLVSALASRQARLEALDERRRSLPSLAAIDLATRRTEAEARRRLGDLRGVLERNAPEARQVLELLLDGPLRVSPIATAEGARFAINGAACLGRVLVVDDVASYIRVPSGIRTRVTALKGLGPGPD
jgi:site-specific DNA recombinase